MTNKTGAGETRTANMSRAARVQAVIGGSAGNLVEWYDWFAYSSFALYFAPVFFPKGDATAQLLQTAAIFAVGFFARPAGAWLMGLYADHYGRRNALAAAIFLMCFGSLIIAFAPTYAQAGAAAPAILLVARIIQGLSVGGEYGASATYLSEVAERRHRGLYSSLQLTTLVAGQLIALSVLLVLQKLLPAETLQAWGWRIPFFIGAGLAIIVFVIRRGLHETDSFKNAKASGAARANTKLLFQKYPKETLMTAGLTMSGSLSFYAFTTYMQKFLVNTSGFDKAAATQIVAAALIFYMFALPCVGALSDKIGRKPVLMASFGLTALTAAPVFFTLAGTTSALNAIVLLCASLLFQCGYTATSAITKAELFPANVRALGVALPYALANSMFGGTAEYVALWFKQRNESGFYYYVALLSAIAFIVAWRMRETQKHSLIVED